MIRPAVIVLALLTGNLAAAEELHRDGHGDPLPRHAMIRLGTVRFRHQDSVTSVLHTPDGKILISCGGDGFDRRPDPFIRFWDSQTGREVRRLSEKASSLVLTPDGKVLVSAGDQALRFWDVATGKCLKTLTQDGVLSLALSHDGKRLAVATRKEGIRLLDAASGKCLRLFEKRLAGGKSSLLSEKHEEYDRELSFSPDDKQVASVSEEGKIRLWDAATGKLQKEFGERDEFVKVVRFAPDGKTVISGGKSLALEGSCGSICLWQAATGKKVRHFEGRASNNYAYSIADLLIAANGKTLISAGNDGTIRIWDITSGKQVRLLGCHVMEGKSLSLSPDEKTLVSFGADHLLRRWDLATSKEIGSQGGHQRGIDSLQFSSDGKTFISIGEDGTRRIWDLATGSELCRQGCRFSDAAPNLFTLSPDGRTMAWRDVNRVYLRDTATNQDRVRLTALAALVELRYSPDGKILVGVPLSDQFHLWDTATGKELHRLENVVGNGNIVFSPDSRLLATGVSLPGLRQEEYLIRILDVATGKEIRRILDRGLVLCFSHNSRLLAVWRENSYTVKREQEIIVWETATGSERVRFRMVHRITAVAFSADGTTIAGGDDGGEVRVWDAITGAERHRFTGDQGRIAALAFSVDGSRLASGGANTTILIWPVTQARRQPDSHSPLSTAKLKSGWADLADRDAAHAFAAMKTLHSHPESSVPFLRERLRPAILTNPQAIERLIACLDDDRFAVREDAMRKLTQFGYAVEPRLRHALNSKPSLESRRRLHHLLENLASDSPEHRRALRALEVLGWVDTLESRRLLKELADGPDDACLNREAKQALPKGGR